MKCSGEISYCCFRNLISYVLHTVSHNRVFNYLYDVFRREQVVF